MSKVNSTISQIVEYALKENQGGHLLMSNVGGTKELIISYFKTQQKKHGKNSISSFIVAQHCGHKVSDEKWVEIWNDLFLELKVTGPKYVVGRHTDGSQDHCHGLLAQFRPNQYLFDEDFKSKVPNKANETIYKENKSKLSAKLFELARKLEEKHQLPPLSISIHYTREYYIPAKFRFKDLMRSIIDESIDSAKTLNEYEKRLQEISSIGISKFKITLIENKKYSYLKRIFDATEMTFEAKQWCNYENVFKIGDFKCRGALLGPDYTKERIIERIIKNSTKLEIDKSNGVYNSCQKSQFIELQKSNILNTNYEISENLILNKGLIKEEPSRKSEVDLHSRQDADLLKLKVKNSRGCNALEFENEIINFNNYDWRDQGVNETKLKLEFSIYERLIEESNLNENGLVLKVKALTKSANEGLALVRKNDHFESDQKYKLRLELSKSIDEVNMSIHKNTEAIERENLRRIILYEEYLKKIKEAALLAELNNLLTIQRRLNELEEKRKMELSALIERANENKRFIKLQKITTDRTLISAMIDKERLSMKKDLINKGLEKILHRRGFREKKTRTQSSEFGDKKYKLKLEQNLLKIFTEGNFIDIETLKEFRDILVGVDSLFRISPKSQSIERINNIAKEHVLDQISFELNNCRNVDMKPGMLLKEDYALKIYNDLLYDFTAHLRKTRDIYSSANLEQLTLNINSFIYLKERKEEIVDVIKLEIKQYNVEMTKIWNLRRNKQIEREDYPNNDHSIDNDHSQQLGLQMIPPWLKQNGYPY